MAGSSTAAALATMEKQPWFPQVAQVFASQKSPIAPDVWEATAIYESGGRPDAANVNAATGDDSHGLFQVNLAGRMASDPARQLAAFGGPVENAKWAAGKMEAAIAKLPASASSRDQLRAVEQAAWPGNLSQDAARQGVLAQVAAAHGEDPSAPNAVAGTSPWDPRNWWRYMDPTNPHNWVPGDPNAGTGAPDWQGFISNAVAALTIGAVFLAFIAGGFAIMAGGGSSNTKVIPV